MSRIWLPNHTEQEMEHSITHLDMDWEIRKAQRERFFWDGLHVQRGRNISGASGLTNTWAEVLYSNPTVGTAKNTFTTEFQVNDTAGMGPVATLPAWFFLPSRARGQALRVVARGVQLGTGSTPPTWLWTFRLNPVVTPAVPPTGPIIAGGVAAVTGTTTASALWEAEFDVQLTLEGAAGNNSTLRGLGQVTSQRGLVSPFGMDLFGGAASPGTVATFDMSLLASLTVGITCGTSLAANQMQLLQLLVMGLN
jgi:hypothetical protein